VRAELKQPNSGQPFEPAIPRPNPRRVIPIRNQITKELNRRLSFLPDGGLHYRYTRAA
jgi:hypothetical protein